MKKYVKSNTSALDKERLYDKLEYAIDILGADSVLEEFSRYMSSDELNNYLDILFRFEDIQYEE